MDYSLLPSWNAFFNSTSALCLVLGFIFIKRGKVTQHRFFMLLACLSSIIFLTGYLIYHYNHGSTRFQGQGGVRYFYFTLLISHTILAVIQVPLIVTTLFFAFKGVISKHRMIARITLPIWLYVSITGVIVYWMLYRVNY